MMAGRSIRRRGVGTALRLLLLLALVLAARGPAVAEGAGAAVLTVPGLAWGWGWDGFGQLGDGVVLNPASDATARQVRNVGNVIAVSAGNYHSLALIGDGGVAAWGDDTFGQMGDGSLGPDLPTPQRVALLGNIVAVAAGGFHNLALRADGAVWSWGRDTEGQLGDGTVSNPETAAVPKLVPGLTGVIGIAAGYDHSLALKADGTVWAWGNDYAGQVGDGTVGKPLLVATPTPVVGLSGVIALAGGHNHSLALKADGTVWAWGRDDWGQLGDGTANQPTDSATPSQVVGLGGVSAIAAGESHNLALKADGTVWGWGANTNGQLGIGAVDLVPHPAPVQADTPSGLITLAAGRFHSLALRADGTIWSWGNDEFGELGDGTIGSPDLQPTPTVIAGLGGMTAIAAGAEHSLAIGSGGTTLRYTLATEPIGSGMISPGTGDYGPGTEATQFAQAQGSSLFTGWLVDGAPQGWANPLRLTMNAPHYLVATFAAPPDFSDVADGQTYAQAVRELAARGFIKGYGDGTFGPNDTILRAQMAALIARAVGWTGPGIVNPFTDRCDPLTFNDCVDPELWGAVGQLASPDRDVARGYTDPATCAPAAVPCYAPRDSVLYAQTISFITRALVAQGLWQPQPDNPALYPNVPAESGHRADLATFVANAGAVPDFGDVNGVFGPWNQPTARGWFARALWQALNSYYGVDRVP